MSFQFPHLYGTHLQLWPPQTAEGGPPPGWNGPVFHGMAPPPAPPAGTMMHFSGYASFVPPSGFPPPNLAMAAVALKSEPPRLVIQSECLG